MDSRRLRLAYSENGAFIEEAKQRFVQSLEEAKLYELKESPRGLICASSLTAILYDKGPEHFLVTKIDEDMMEKLKSQYVNGLCHGAEERMKGKYLEVILAAFQLDLAKSRNALAESEAKVRFSLVDPLVRLLSDFDCQCKVCTMLKRPEWLGRFSIG